MKRNASRSGSRAMRRRTFLKALGVGALGGACLPLLESVGTSAPASFPNRLIIFFSANGTIPDAWRPDGEGAGSAWSIPDDGILAPLQRHKQDLLVIEGVDMLSARHGPGDGHQTGMGHMLTGTELLNGPFQGGNGGSAGYAGGISVDQYIANNIHDGEPYKSLEFGVQCGGPNNWSRMSYAGPDQPIEPAQNAHSAFDRIFASQSMSEERARQLRNRRASVLDFVGEDLNKISKKVSAEDRSRIEQHLTSVREVEQRLLTGDGNGVACMEPNRGQPFDSSKHENYAATGDLMMDMIVSALACGTTRVASMQWSRSVSNITLPWAGVGNDRHHDLSHEGDGNTTAKNKLIKINTWYAERFAALLDKLKAVPEGDGTLLDHTTVVWCNELGKGNSHTRNNVPYVIAGGGTGWATDRYMRFDMQPHNDFLVSLSNAMGVPTQTFGNPAYCNGPLPGLS